MIIEVIYVVIQMLCLSIALCAVVLAIMWVFGLLDEESREREYYHNGVYFYRRRRR